MFDKSAIIPLASDHGGFDMKEYIMKHLIEDGFKVKDYDGYKGRNPKTGEIINVGRKKLPFFKVGKELKERVDII